MEVVQVTEQLVYWLAERAPGIRYGPNEVISRTKQLPMIPYMP